MARYLRDCYETKDLIASGYLPHSCKLVKWPGPKLLDQLRSKTRYRHYRNRTSQGYVYWVKFYIKLHGLRPSQKTGEVERRQFLHHMANQRQCSASTLWS